MLVQDLELIKGLRVGPLVEKVLLYADALLYLKDLGPFLQAALEVFNTFRDFLGICIGWFSLL